MVADYTNSNKLKYQMSSEIWYKKNIVNWALYDLGNTIYSMIVVSLTITSLVQIMFYTGGAGTDAINLGNLAFATSLFIGNFFMVIISPFLGAYADQFITIFF